MGHLVKKYARAKMFSGMNKQQRQLWKAQHGGKYDPKAQQQAEKIKKGA